MEAPGPSAPRKRRWGWRQYSISALLVVVTIVGVGLGPPTFRAERQRRAVAAIRESRGFVRYDFQPEFGKFEPDKDPGGLAELLGVDYSADVTSVYAADSFRVTDSTCSHLSKLTSLRQLYLNRTQITDGGLAHLAALTKLKQLYLHNTLVTDAGLAHLERLKSLQTLSLYNTRVSDAGLEHLEGLTNLQDLYLGGTRVSDAGLERLTGLTKLRDLSLSGAQVTSAGCDKLRQALPNCRVHHYVYNPRTFRSELTRLIGMGRYDDAVLLVESADVERQLEHDGSGYLAIGQMMIMLPGVDEIDYSRMRDWYFPGTQDAIEHADWQAAATGFAWRYNRLRAEQRD